MSQPNNPWIKSMTRLQVPSAMSTNLCVGGFNLETDENGQVEVPAEHVPTLLAHGLTIAKPDDAKDKKAK